MISKRDAFTIVFLGISLFSAIFLVHATLNYVEFYSAIAKLDITVIDVTTSIDETNITVTLTFQITNPTTYRGLKLHELASLLKFEDNDELVDLWWKTTAYSEPIPIEPISEKTFQYSFDLNVDSNATKRFIRHYETHQGNIKWLLNCGALVSTFIGKIEIPLTAIFEEH